MDLFEKNFHCFFFGFRFSRASVVGSLGREERLSDLSGGMKFDSGPAILKIPCQVCVGVFGEPGNVGEVRAVVKVASLRIAD